MKKVLTLLLATAIGLTAVLSGCSKKDGGESSSDAQDTSSEETSSESSKMELVQFETPGEDALIATIKTSMGEIKATLFPKYAPKAVQNFYQHAVDGYYNGRTFYYVIDNYYIMTGDPTDEGRGGESIWKKPFEDEFTDDLWNFRGALSMYNDDKPDNNGSRFMIVQCKEVDENTLKSMDEHKDLFPQEVIDKYKEIGGVPFFDHKYPVFGYVTSTSMSTVDKIAAIEVEDASAKKYKPKEKVIIETIGFNRTMSYPPIDTEESSSSSK